MRLKLIIIEVFKSIQELNPDFINRLFQQKIIRYSLRDHDKLQTYKPKSTTYGFRSFLYIGAKLWNELPQRYKPAMNESLETFKRRLECWNGPKDIDYFINYV